MLHTWRIYTVNTKTNKASYTVYTYDPSKPYEVTTYSKKQAIQNCFLFNGQTFYHDKWNDYLEIYNENLDEFICAIQTTLSYEEIVEELNKINNSRYFSMTTYKPEVSAIKTKKQNLKDDFEIDVVTSRLMADALKTHGKDCCPRCGSIGCMRGPTWWCNDCRMPIGGF